MNHFKHTPDEHLMEGFRKYLDNLKSTLLSTHNYLQEDTLINMLSSLRDDCEECIEINQGYNLKPTYRYTLLLLLEKDFLNEQSRISFDCIAGRIIGREYLESYRQEFLETQMDYSEIALKYDVGLGFIDADTYKAVFVNKLPNRENKFSKLEKAIKDDLEQGYFNQEILLNRFHAVCQHFFLYGQQIKSTPGFNLVTSDFIDSPAAAKIEAASEFKQQFHPDNPTLLLNILAYHYVQSSILNNNELSGTIETAREIIQAATHLMHVVPAKSEQLEEKIMMLCLLPFPQQFHEAYPGKASKALFESLFARCVDTPADEAVYKLMDTIYVRSSEVLEPPGINSPIKKIINSYGIKDFNYSLLRHSVDIVADAIIQPEEYKLEDLMGILANSDKLTIFNLIKPLSIFFSRTTSELDVERAKLITELSIRVINHKKIFNLIAKHPLLIDHAVEKAIEIDRVSNRIFMDAAKALHPYIMKRIHEIKSPAAKHMLLSFDLDL